MFMVLFPNIIIAEIPGFISELSALFYWLYASVFTSDKLSQLL